ncbi:hypothetical protein LUZ63_013745 [Rhynchospora breviuscula]|uniref:NAB domain-containing protein n=1 Tax=Rhynchospora breviuscula TaxID=2022672 RepID=A0A9Q0C958_9POAL|nr:hypothetical protein LUZ63_013745 [Rhynchospora breviuscula]
MTRKHRIEHFLSSIVGTHFHSDSSDVLEKKKEIEKNLEKILKLIGDDTSTNPEYSLDSVHKSELSSLIKEFHSGYQALYENYDHLIGKLKKNISPKKRENGNLQSKHSSSSSDSSDSDLDETAPLVAKLEEKDAEIRNLDNKLESVSGENEALKLENNMVREEVNNFKKEIEEKEFVISNLKTEIESVCGENEVLKLENKVAGQEILKFGKEAEERELALTNLKKEIESACEENDILKSVNKEARQEISKFEKEAEKRESDILNLKKEIESIRRENELLKSENKDARQEILKFVKEAEEKESVISNLKNELERISREKEVLIVAQKEAFSQLSQVEKTLEVSEITNDELKKETLKLKEELEEKDLVISNMQKEVERMETIENENGALHDRLRVISEENEVFVQASESEIDQLRVEVSDLSQKIEEKNDLEADMNRQLNDAYSEKEALLSTNSGLLCELKEAKDDRESLRLLLEQANANVDELGSKLVSVETENKNMQEEMERLCNKLHEEESMVGEITLKCKEIKDEREKLIDANGVLNAKLEKELTEKAELKQILEMQENENALLASTVEKREVELQGLTDERDKLNAIKSELEHGIDGLRDKIQVLHGEKEGVEVHSQHVERDLEEATLANLKLQAGIDNISKEKLKVEEEVKSIFEKCLENQVLVKKWEERIRGKIVNQETPVADLACFFTELVSTCKELKDAYVGSMVHIATLESLNREQSRELNSMEETCLNLKEKLALSEGETVKLKVQLPALEVQLRLANQKLRITETECRYKEESSDKLVEGLNSKVRDLEGKMSKMIARLSFLETQLVETEQNAKVGISALGNRIKELKSIFDERFASFVSRVLELNEELKFLKKNLDEELSEKEKMKNRLVELESRIKEEEIEINLKDEEKREAIRQLCMAIEYYRENCDLLIAISQRTQR